MTSDDMTAARITDRYAFAAWHRVEGVAEAFERWARVERLGNSALANKLREVFGLDVTPGKIAGRVHRLGIDRGGSKPKGERKLANKGRGVRVPRKMVVPGLLETKEAEFRRLWEDGASYAVMRPALSLNGTTIRRVAADLGLPPRPPGYSKPPAALRERVIKVKAPKPQPAPKPNPKPRPRAIEASNAALVVEAVPVERPALVEPAPAVTLFRPRPLYECAWPMDATPCEDHAVLGKPYCAAHCARAYASITRRSG